MLFIYTGSRYYFHMTSLNINNIYFGFVKIPDWLTAVGSNFKAYNGFETMHCRRVMLNEMLSAVFLNL